MNNKSDTFPRIRAWLQEHLHLIKTYPSELHRLLILLSLIDSFAQDCSNQSRQNQKSFVDFLQTYCKKYNAILKSQCPVTLYYHYLDKLPNLHLHLQEGRIYYANSCGAIAEAERIICYLDEKEKVAAQLKHSYAGLIYQLRNKLSHEFMMLNMPINFQNNEDIQLPHMATCIENNKVSHWSLCIPEHFVREVAIDAFENYLSDCEERNYIPFSNQNRKCYYAWYD